MKRSILLCAALLAACGSESGEQPPPSEKSLNPATDSAALEGVPRAGVIPEVQKRVDRAEADMAERARQAEEQVRAAEGGTSQP